MMRLSPGLFNRQLAVMGQAVLWRRASLCPCAGRDHYSGGPSQDCPVCTGRGWAWGAGVPSRAGVVGAGAKRKQADFGQWEDGEVSLSVPSDTPLWNAGERDRVEFADGDMGFQLALRNSGAPRIDFTPVRFERCFWLRAGDTAFREADPPKWDKATGFLSWPANSIRPDAGEHFTLVGRKRPDFQVVASLPIARAHFNGLPLPRLLKCVRTDLALK